MEKWLILGLGWEMYKIISLKHRNPEERDPNGKAGGVRAAKNDELGPQHTHIQIRLPWGHRGKESACQCWRYRFNPWVRKIPWRVKWQYTPALLPGKSHGRRSLIGYKPWGHKELDTT